MKIKSIKKIDVGVDTCFECNSTDDIQKHHVIPVVLGGTRTLPLCGDCHSKVHSKELTHWKTLMTTGRERAKKRGITFGRPTGSSESIDIFLNKSKIQKIINELKSGKSVRCTARSVPCSTSTIYKVKQLLKTV